MDLKIDTSLAEGYKNKSQIVRILTENWVSKNIYCPSCGNHELKEFVNNSPVADFLCSNCNEEYELKSKKDNFSPKIVDGAFKSMIERIHANNNPHFFFLNYSDVEPKVKNFLVIPKHYFIDTIIEKRKPLSPNAKRAGWVGCNILLNNIPDTGKIFFVKNSEIKSQHEVLTNWERTSFLANQTKHNRGWTIEIMKVLERIPRKDFSLQDVYSYTNELQAKFPKNNFVKDKIRQQLQLLRDRGFLEFKGRGKYSKI